MTDARNRASDNAMPSDRLARLRAATRPARRWLAVPSEIPRWIVLILAVLAAMAVLGCATPTAPDLSTREGVRAEAQRLRATYGDPANWPPQEWARWEEAVRGSR